MNAQISTLLTAVARAGEAEPVDLFSALRDLPEPGALPSPWETWTLIGLVRHRGRQLWVADIIRNRLRGTPSDLARMGALGHPQGVPQTGPVPGMLIANIPINRAEAAAILAVICKPWSIRELLRALESSNNQEKTADARAALVESGDEAAQKAVLAWEVRNPHENEAGSYLEIDGRRLGPFFTLGELSLQNRATRIRYEMDKLHDRVMKVKSVIPPEPPEAGPWWRFWRT